MNNILEYKGYYTKIQFSKDDNVLYGKIEDITDLVNFESESACEIEQEFHMAVDDYLEFCNNVGKEPSKAYRGMFNVRISPLLHKQVANLAQKKGKSLNQIVEEAIQDYVDKNRTIIKMAKDEGKKLLVVYRPKEDSLLTQYNIKDDWRDKSDK